MREILFRGKRTDNQEWVYGVPTKDDFDATFMVQGIFECDEYRCNGADCYDVDEKTLGQYTGLTDKNGTKIFEGDIVKHVRTLWGKDNSDIGVILWCENTCKFYRTSKFDTINKVEIWKYTAEDYEVIGNIHDNPELLGGGEE